MKANGLRIGVVEKFFRNDAESHFNFQSLKFMALDFRLSSQM